VKPQGNGSAPQTISTGDLVKEDISDPALMHARSALSEREENPSEVAARGVDRVRYGSIYGVLAGLAAVSGITTPALRARARRVALTLALAGADPDRVAAVGAVSTRQVGSLPIEIVANRVLDELRSGETRGAAEAQFRAPEEARPECGLCDGLSHLIADGIAIGCPHNLERVQSWAAARRWAYVGSPTGKVIHEREVGASRPEATSPPLPEEIAMQSDSEPPAESDERRALNTAGAKLLLEVLAKVREQHGRLE